MLKQRLRVLLGLVMQALAIKVDIMALRLEDWAHRFEDRALKKIRTLEAMPPPPPRRKPHLTVVLQDVCDALADFATDKPWLLIIVCGVIIAVGTCAFEQMLFPSSQEDPGPAVYTGEVNNCGTVSNNVTVTTNALPEISWTSPIPGVATIDGEKVWVDEKGQPDYDVLIWEDLTLVDEISDSNGNVVVEEKEDLSWHLGPNYTVTPDGQLIPRPVFTNLPPPHPDEISKIHDPSIHLVTTEYWRCPSVTNTLAEYCSECPHCNQGGE